VGLTQGDVWYSIHVYPSTRRELSHEFQRLREHVNRLHETGPDATDGLPGGL
jgi:hypothetical protein